MTLRLVNEYLNKLSGIIFFDEDHLINPKIGTYFNITNHYQLLFYGRVSQGLKTTEWLKSILTAV